MFGSFSKCGHCGGTSTKTAEIEPHGARFKQIAICCASCGSILSTMGYQDTAALVIKQGQQLQSLQGQVDYLTNLIENLSRRLG